ncbi:MAG: response regulator transcription factor [Acidimicrobiia bacterium]|nr:response regulator transcription factor [Acidimicrobiia bacterium]
MSSVLVVEDEPKVASAIRQGLEGEGYTVDVASTGEDAFFRINTETFSVVLMDLSLPGRDGLDIIRALRQRDADTRVLIVTARDGLNDRIAGLNSGADDYLVKPFAFGELVARIRALERRGRSNQGQNLKLGPLEMNVWTRKVTRGERPIDLTAREFTLLEYLLRSAGYVVSRDALARDVWDERERTPTLDNVIDAHIARLRKKVDEEGASRLIHTVRGVGFVLREEP